MNIFAFIKSRVSVYQVASEYVTLKKAGAYWKGRCPFHNERTASFTISPHREIFYCFGCHKGGDVIAFISLAENLSQLKAAQYLATCYNIQIPNGLINDIAPENGKDSQRYNQLCSIFAQWCHDKLLKNENARDYLIKRGLSLQAIQDFEIGYFPEKNYQELLEHVKKDGFLAKDLLEANIMLEGRFANALFSPFAERIIFPIKDQLGRVCGFGGRVFKADDNRPKYYNSQDHVFFSKGNILFGLDRAKKNLQSKQSVFLVEGYLDCISMVQAGYTNTVATLGTACTVQQCNLLSRYAQTAYIIYDGDKAGQDATVKIAQIMWHAGIEPFVVVLPPSYDPASFLQEHNNLDSLITNAQDIFRYFISKLGSGYNSKPLQEKIILVQELMNIVHGLDDGIKKNLLLEQAAATFAIPFQVLVQEVKKQAKHDRQKQPILTDGKLISTQPEDHVDKSIQPTCATTWEASAFVALIRAENLPSDEECDLIGLSCSRPIRLLIQKFLIYYKNDREKNLEINFNNFLLLLDANEQAIALHLVMQGDQLAPLGLDSIIALLWKKDWKLKVSDVKIRLKAAEQAGDFQAMGRIGAEFDQLKNKMREKGIL